MLDTEKMGHYDQLQVRSERQTVSGLREGKRCDIYVCSTVCAQHSAYMNYTATRLYTTTEVSKIIFIRNDFKWFRIIRYRMRYLDTLIELFGIPLIIVMAISSRLHCLESGVVSHKPTS
jgi:hypothetical protein